MIALDQPRQRHRDLAALRVSGDEEPPIERQIVLFQEFSRRAKRVEARRRADVSDEVWRGGSSGGFHGEGMPEYDGAAVCGVRGALGDDRGRARYAPLA